MQNHPIPQDAIVIEMADRLDAGAAAYRPSSAAFVNPAKLLAADLSGGLPVVLGDGAVAGVAARRAAMMLARTARVPATVGELPGSASEVVALLDVGPDQLGAPRIAHLASLVVLAARAEREKGTLIWGFLQDQSGSLHAGFTAASASVLSCTADSLTAPSRSTVYLIATRPLSTGSRARP